VHAERTDERLANFAFLQGERGGGKNLRAWVRWRSIQPMSPPALLLGASEFCFAASAKEIFPVAISSRSLGGAILRGVDCSVIGFSRQFEENLGRAELRAVEISAIAIEIFFEVRR